MSTKLPEFIVTDWRKIPDHGKPEIAIVGRSNVGKSSLINSLLGRKRAKVSQTPGKTQTINGYEQPRFFLVDLPGFGYAKVSQKDRLQWQQSMADYFGHRTALMGLLHLVDVRHPWQEVDVMISEWLSPLPVRYQVVLTKIDKLSTQALYKQQQYYQKTLALRHAHPEPLLLTSSQAKKGLQETLTRIQSWL